MKRILFIAMLFAALAVGCTRTTPPVGPTEHGQSSYARPTILISTTKGDMKAVLFPVFVEFGGKVGMDPREEQFTAFLGGVDHYVDDKVVGYYNGAVASSRDEGLDEFIVFTSVSKDPNFRINPQPRSDIQPVRGTLCMMRMDSGNEAGIYADKRQFMIVRRIVRKYHGQELSLLRGTHFPIGQIVAGLDVLDKLTASDTIKSITMLKQSEWVDVSAKRLQMLGDGEIDNFADVLKPPADDESGAKPESSAPAGGP